MRTINLQDLGKLLKLLKLDLDTTAETKDDMEELLVEQIVAGLGCETVEGIVNNITEDLVSNGRSYSLNDILELGYREVIVTMPDGTVKKFHNGERYPGYLTVRVTMSQVVRGGTTVLHVKGE